MCCVSKGAYDPSGSRNCTRFSGRIWKCAVSISALRRGGYSAQGELFVFCLYSDGEEDHPLQWVEQALPFQAEVECQGCISEMIPRIESTLGQTTLEIQPDSDGEERVLQAEAVLELDICLYQEETVSLLQDVYHPHRECIPKVQEETLESLLIRNSSKCRLTDKLQMRVSKNKFCRSATATAKSRSTRKES